jgi:TonB family protein
MMSVIMLAVLLAQALPAPAPSGAACQQEADVLKPEIPHDFDTQEIDRPLVATVAVVVEPDGTIKKASIYRSSGDLSFDGASVAAARASKYRPKIVNCAPVESTYYFKTSVTPQY